MAGIHPARQPVGDVARVAVRGDAALEPGGVVNRAAVVDARRPVKVLVAARSGLVQAW